jgi:phosphatidylglycerophosphate synthase
MIIVCRELLVMGLRGSVAVSGTVIQPSQLGRTKAAVQFVAIILLLLRVNLRLGPTGIGEWALWIAAALTVLSAADYIWRWAASALRGSAPATPK